MIFVFNGNTLSDILEIESIDMPAAAPVGAEVRPVPGMDGAAFCGSALEPMEITVKARLATDCIEPAEIQRRWARVAALLMSDGPAPLTLQPGLYRMAYLSADTQLKFRSYSASASLKFVCPDPVAYGRERTVTVPSGGSVEFDVEGTYRAAPTIAAQAVRAAGTLVWGLRLDGGDFIHVATGSASARSVEADCAKRTCLVQGSPSLPTLDSDWLALEPGSHVLAMDQGTGAATVTFRERWL